MLQTLHKVLSLVVDRLGAADVDGLVILLVLHNLSASRGLRGYPAGPGASARQRAACGAHAAASAEDSGQQGGARARHLPLWTLARRAVVARLVLIAKLYALLVGLLPSRGCAGAHRNA